ncbi:peptidase domain-containing ABC transporter [Stenotrophomonas maltophilia]|uniref:peptidase domain-containing ABC transporter n=1 Tax=Stenotrophomonas maltophilia TaxID=40324 RepID=UPI000C25DC85
MDPNRDTSAPVSAEEALQGGAWQRMLKFSSKSRVPYISQTQGAECGLACLAMISTYHGKKVDLPTLRAKFPTSLRGARLNDLMEVAHGLDLTARPVQVALEDIDQLEVPCILHWNMSHFVVLTKVDGKHVEVMDPAKGRLQLDMSQVSTQFTGVALELLPSSRFEKSEEVVSVSLRQLAGHVKGLRRGLIQVFLIALAIECFNLLTPQFLQLVVDQVVSDGDRDLMTLLGLGFCLLLAVRVLSEGIRSWIIMWVSSNVGIAWSGNVFSHLLRLPLPYFAQRHLGDLMSRYGAISVIQSTITTKLVTAVIDGIMAVLTAVVLFVYSKMLALITILFVAVYCALRMMNYRFIRERSEEQINAVASQQTTLIESLRGMQTIRLNNRAAQRAGKFMNATADTINAGISLQRIGIAFSLASQACSGLQRIVVIWIAAWLTMAGSMTIGMLMAFVAYSDQFTTRILSFADYVVQFRLLRLQGERLADIVLTEPEKYDDPQFVGELHSSCIRFDDVEFRYGSNLPAVISGCTFEIPDGEVVAITGPSGCGKTTLGKLLVGLYDQDGGAITIGGIDTRQLGKRRTRKLIATVFQDDRLFSGSIADNISLFDADALLEDVRAAAEQANIVAEIEAMPMGFHTLVGDMGGALSAGQQQRVLLARALYRKPKVLLMDEATSNLDIENEMKICAAVRAAGVTTVLIAHRPQTIQSADRVLELREGMIRELRCSNRSSTKKELV